MDPVKCVWLERSNQTRLFLRRFKPESCVHGYCNAMAFLRDVPETKVITGDDWVYRHEGPQSPADVPDVVWPAACEVCGYTFTDKDERQIFSQHLYRTPRGPLVTLAEAAPGSMWDAEWMPDSYKGFDGRAVVVKLPNGQEWLVDGRASNCDKPEDREHRCWVRHGDVKKPETVTVDKAGRTCNAGAGSVWSRQGLPNEWHGFLTLGVLRRC